METKIWCYKNHCVESALHVVGIGNMWGFFEVVLKVPYLGSDCNLYIDFIRIVHFHAQQS